MNRKTFLSSLLALITAPFLGKSKENGTEFKGQMIDGVLPEQPAGYFNDDLDRRVKSLYEKYNAINVSGTFTVKGEDLKMVLNRKR